MKIWEDKEVFELFEMVESCKESKNPLKYAFSNFANKYNRKANSVRNYYYKEVDNLSVDKNRCKKLGIDISKHDKYHFDGFEEKNENELLRNIDNLVKNDGLSVRSACLKLSDGDLTLMTRFQNKYQNLKKKSAKQKNENNIIQFKKRQKLLTESDINSLFMGLVKLIRQTAIEEFMEKTKQEKESSAYLLKKAFLDLSKKDKQIGKLREDFEILKKENSILSLQLNDLNKHNSLKNKLSKVGSLSSLNKDKMV